jgi:hypothetical protein
MLEYTWGTPPEPYPGPQAMPLTYMRRPALGEHAPVRAPA